MITLRPVTLCDSCRVEIDHEQATEQAVDWEGVDYRICSTCSALGVRLAYYREPDSGRLHVSLTTDRIPGREGGLQ